LWKRKRPYFTGLATRSNGKGIESVQEKATTISCLNRVTEEMEQNDPTIVTAVETMKKIFIRKCVLLKEESPGSATLCLSGNCTNKQV